MLTPIAPDPTPAILAMPCPCLRTADLPARVADRLLPLESVHSAFVDVNNDGILLTDRRLIIWSRRGAPISLSVDEVRLECRISGLFATLVISMLHGAGQYTRAVRLEHLDPMTELLDTFSANGRIDTYRVWRGQLPVSAEMG
jgi:hypothetical protein